MDFLGHMVMNSELMEDGLPGQVIVELTGGCRVLIEGHRGVKEYSREKILVNTKIGAVCVGGCGMEILRMNRERLVIQGRIDTINLLRRA